jgi:hypothetical protein
MHQIINSGEEACRNPSTAAHGRERLPVIFRDIWDCRPLYVPPPPQQFFVFLILYILIFKNTF